MRRNTATQQGNAQLGRSLRERLAALPRVQVRQLPDLVLFATICMLAIIHVAGVNAVIGENSGGSASRSARAFLDDTLLVGWYGNPLAPAMGALGQYDGPDRAARLEQQASQYETYTNRRIRGAFHLVAVVAQATPGEDGKWRNRMGHDFIEAQLEDAREHGFQLILDIQPGHSTVRDEIEYLRPFLEEPGVHLAIDPQFDMWPGEVPGKDIGHTAVGDVNYALSYLSRTVNRLGLPPKILIVHQFHLDMLPSREEIHSYPSVDLVIDMDGLGPPDEKVEVYRTVMKSLPPALAGIKLFYDHDAGMLTPEDVLNLDPIPAVVIYQ